MYQSQTPHISIENILYKPNQGVLPVSHVAGADHLSLLQKQTGSTEELLVLLWAGEDSGVQSLQGHGQVVQTRQDKLATEHPVGMTLTLP